MKKHINIIDTRNWTMHEWLLYRKRGLGASDVGTVLGLNPYKSRLELFYERISPKLDLSIDNMAKFMGKVLEDLIAEDLWPYWEGTEESVIMNKTNGKIIRKCQRVRGYVNNPKYPWLFVSLDRKINKINGTDEGALEIKTIAGWEANKWEAGIPMSHVAQICTQIVVCEFSFGEVATLEDGRRFFVYPFERMPALEKTIITETKHFWETVEEGRIIRTQQYEAEKNFNKKLVEELEQRLVALEPEPDGTEAYEKFLKEKFKRNIAQVGLIKGTDDDFKMALELVKVKNKISKFETEKRLYENTLKRRIGQNQILDFGKDGEITWRGQPRTFLVKVKGEKKDKL